MGLLFSQVHTCVFMNFGDNVSRSGSRQKNVACFFSVCLVCDAFCSLSSLPLVVECPSLLNSSLFILFWENKVHQK